MTLNRSLFVGFGTTAVLLLLQVPLLAQTQVNRSASHQALANPVRPLYPVIHLPELPPIQPVFPDPSPRTRLVLRLSERKVYVYEDDELKTTYPVAVGRQGWETPTGQFEVFSMISNPGWTNPFTGETVPPGPRNPLGERWIAFWTDGNNYIGFHGTPNRSSIGRAASHGCIRMYNEDVRELFEIVELGTLVVVEP